MTYDGIVDAEHVQFGPLATQSAAAFLRAAIEFLEGHEDLWILRDDDHEGLYDRDLTSKSAPVNIRTPAQT